MKTARPDRATSTVRAAIDIGTNSIHFVVARIDDSGRFDIITREKESVRLGHGSGEMSELAPDAIDRGIAALRRFRQVADGENASHHRRRDERGAGGDEQRRLHSPRAATKRASMCR